MRYLKVKKLFCLLLVCAVGVTFAVTDKKVSLDLENVNLIDALRISAKFMGVNLIVSPVVTGTVSLHLQEAREQEIFDLLIASQGLAKEQVGNVLLVSSYSEMIKRKEEIFKLKEATNDTTALETEVWQIRYAKAEDIARLLQDANASLLSKRGRLKVDPRTNILCVQDLAANLSEVKKLVNKWDVPIQQVLIEARLASVDSDYERELGINFSVHYPVGPRAGHIVVDPVSAVPKYSLAVATLADGSLLDIALAAMENQGHGDLISSPSLFTANQQTAVIESGEEIPYQEVSLSGGTGVAFKKAVLSLKVTPQIMPDDKVLLQLNVNQDRPSSRIVLGVPAISTRQITTNVLVKNGQTLVLGGIYELNKELDEQRLPFLGKIPVVGILFRQQNRKENKRELLIFVTPKIIS